MNDRNQHGFSLLELIIVMTIIGLIAFLVPPLMTNSIENLKLRTAANNITVSLRYAKARAVAEKFPFSFNLDPKTNKYWLSAKDINEKSDKADKLKLNIQKKISEDIKVRATQNIKDYYNSSGDHDDVFTVDFFKNGNSSGGKITLRKNGKRNGNKETEDGRYYNIFIDIFTGNIQLEESSKDEI